MQATENLLGPIFLQRQPDLTEENIQSRLRGLLLMALSNKFGPLVLTTGNKSELAVGYCTLYGDMCGALAVIADVLKTEIYALAEWINRAEGSHSVEHDPQAAQRGAAPRPDRPGQPAALRSARPDFAPLCRGGGRPQDAAGEGVAPEIVRDVLNKIGFSEYKRRQAAPGLKVSPRAFGMGRRVPSRRGFGVETAGNLRFKNSVILSLSKDQLPVISSVRINVKVREG